jgi:hypothetical protein
MSEKVTIEELSRRIDQLLSVLTIISRDLTEISESLKVISTPTTPEARSATTSEETRTISDVKTLFPSDLGELLIFEETEDYVIIKIRRFLGSDNFSKIAAIVRSVDGEYVSAGKDSHFKVSKKL